MDTTTPHHYLFSWIQQPPLLLFRHINPPSLPLLLDTTTPHLVTNLPTYQLFFFFFLFLLSCFLFSLTSSGWVFLVPFLFLSCSLASFSLSCGVSCGFPFFSFFPSSFLVSLSSSSSCSSVSCCFSWACLLPSFSFCSCVSCFLSSYSFSTPFCFFSSSCFPFSCPLSFGVLFSFSPSCFLFPFSFVPVSFCFLVFSSLLRLRSLFPFFPCSSLPPFSLVSPSFFFFLFSFCFFFLLATDVCVFSLHPLSQFLKCSPYTVGVL